MAKITRISIENFKGIRDRIELEIRPITLLFGANSAGKSTVLHALHYAREIFERHNLNPDRTIAGGNFVDLGGFKNLVHDHDLDRIVKLEFQLSLDRYELSVALEERLTAWRWRPGQTSYLPSPVDCFFNVIEAASVSVEVCWSRLLSAPFVRQYEVSFDCESFAQIHHEPGRPSSQLVLNVSHHALKSCEECYEEIQDDRFDWGPEETDLSGLGNFIHCSEPDTLLEGTIRWTAPDDKYTFNAHFELYSRNDALPDWNGPIRFEHPEFDDDDEPDSNDPLSSTRLGVRAFISETIAQTVFGPGKLLHDTLVGLRYLGPLRETPEREFLPPKYSDPSRWSSGLGAWDQLLSEDSKLVATVSEWLNDPERLNSGYSLERKQYKELDLSDPLLIKLISGRAFDDADSNAKVSLDRLPTLVKLVIIPDGLEVELRPHDVGIGISQVVPVLVTALDGKNRLLGIEQPELHLHPRLQAELGDLFIESTLGDRQHTVILETHSEHLILRLLRRIRETTDSELPEGKRPLTSEHLSVYYIEQTDQGAKATLLRVDETGEFVDRWPEGFFEERAKELF